MLVTPAGIVMLVSNRASLKAKLPMPVTPAGIMTESTQ